MKSEVRRIIAVLAVAGASLLAASAETAALDLNSYYQFPLSLGIQYRSLSPLADYGQSYDLADLSVSFRLPLGGMPVLQPTLESGLLQFTPRSTANSKWTHRDVYGLFGVTYANRVGKNFEVGGSLLAGASVSMFPQLVPDSDKTSIQPNFVAELGAKLLMVPAFNFAVELSPSLRYMAAMGPLPDFDGFLFDIGLSAHVRLGEDPDAPKSVLRSLRLGLSKMQPVFPAMQAWYLKNPLATVTVQNTERFPVENVEVTFFQKGFMDSPTVCARLAGLGPGESRDVGITAAFNQEVFRNEGTTPLSGEIAVTYVGKGRAGEQKTSVSYDLLDKSAIVWDDDRKEAAFITPADSALRNYASYIRQTCKGKGVEGYNEAVQFACELFHALGELGILYQVDPTQPFESVRGASQTIDSVSLPRDTLRRITGDCDDLTALYASMLESAGIPTAFITVPGHIYAAFDAKVAPKAYGDVHGDREMTLVVGDRLWVPVEITMIGKSTFVEAWKKAVDEWNAAPAAERRFYETAKAQEIYRPVGLRETDLGLQYGRKDPVVANSVRDINALVDGITGRAMAAAKASGQKEDWNKAGIKLARFGRLDQAVTAFKQAASLDLTYAGPRINLGNVLFLQKNFEKALAEYRGVEGAPALKKDDHNLALLRINISKCYNMLGNAAKAADYLRLASSLEPELAEQYAYLAVPTAETGGGSTARAAEASDTSREVVFAE